MAETENPQANAIARALADARRVINGEFAPDKPPLFTKAVQLVEQPTAYCNVWVELPIYDPPDPSTETPPTQEAVSALRRFVRRINSPKTDYPPDEELGSTTRLPLFDVPNNHFKSMKFQAIGQDRGKVTLEMFDATGVVTESLLLAHYLVRQRGGAGGLPLIIEWGYREPQDYRGNLSRSPAIFKNQIYVMIQDIKFNDSLGGRNVTIEANMDAIGAIAGDHYLRAYDELGNLPLMRLVMAEFAAFASTAANQFKAAGRNPDSISGDAKLFADFMVAELGVAKENVVALLNEMADELSVVASASSGDETQRGLLGNPPTIKELLAVFDQLGGDFQERSRRIAKVQEFNLNFRTSLGAVLGSNDSGQYSGLRKVMSYLLPVVAEVKLHPLEALGYIISSAQAQCQRANSLETRFATPFTDFEVLNFADERKAIGYKEFIEKLMQIDAGSGNARLANRFKFRLGLTGESGAQIPGQFIKVKDVQVRRSTDWRQVFGSITGKIALTQTQRNPESNSEQGQIQSGGGDMMGFTLLKSGNTFGGGAAASSAAGTNGVDENIKAILKIMDEVFIEDRRGDETVSKKFEQYIQKRTQFFEGQNASRRLEITYICLSRNPAQSLFASLDRARQRICQIYTHRPSVRPRSEGYFQSRSRSVLDARTPDVKSFEVSWSPDSAVVTLLNNGTVRIAQNQAGMEVQETLSQTIDRVQQQQKAADPELTVRQRGELQAEQNFQTENQRIREEFRQQSLLNTSVENSLNFMGLTGSAAENAAMQKRAIQNLRRRMAMTSGNQEATMTILGEPFFANNGFQNYIWVEEVLPDGQIGANTGIWLIQEAEHTVMASGSYDTNFKLAKDPGSNLEQSGGVVRFLAGRDGLRASLRQAQGNMAISSGNQQSGS